MNRGDLQRGTPSVECNKKQERKSIKQCGEMLFPLQSFLQDIVR